MVPILGVHRLLALCREGIFPELDSVSQGSIESDQDAVELSMELDDFLQFSLLDGVRISDELLDITEETVRGGWDPELTERTLGWIAKHRERNGLES